MKSIKKPSDMAEIRRDLLEGREVSVSVPDTSMEPFMRQGEEALLRRYTNVHVGEIVLAEHVSGYYIIHRVIKADGNNFVLMGDGITFGTENCRRENVLGTVVAIIRRDGRRIDPNSKRERRKERLWRMAPLPRKCINKLVNQALMRQARSRNK